MTDQMEMYNTIVVLHFTTYLEKEMCPSKPTDFKIWRREKNLSLFILMIFLLGISHEKLSNKSAIISWGLTRYMFLSFVV